MVGVRWSKYYTSLDMTSLRVWLSLPIQAPAKLKVRAFTHERCNNCRVVRCKSDTAGEANLSRFQ